MSEYISGSEGNDGDADFAVNTQNDSKNPDATAVFELPEYDIPSRSSRDPLTMIVISNEIRANYWRSRSMLYEIARKERRWTSFVFRNKDTTIKLLGPALELDRALYTMIHDYSIHGAVGIDISSWCSYGRYKPSNFEGELLEKVRELILNDLEIKTLTASATATLLGLNKRLRDDFIQPLKQCMVNKQEVDYKDLLEKVEEIHEEVVDCYRYLNHQFSQRQEKIMEKAMIDFPENQSRIITGRKFQSRKLLGRGEYQSHKVPVREEHQREKLRQGGFGDDKIRDEKKIGDEEYLDVHNGLKT